MDWVLPGGFLVAYKGVQFVMMTAFSGFRVFGFSFLTPPPCSAYSTYEVWRPDRGNSRWGRGGVGFPSSENEREGAGKEITIISK